MGPEPHGQRRTVALPVGLEGDMGEGAVPVARAPASSSDRVQACCVSAGKYCQAIVV
jgi:hypothetical protein